MCGWSLPTVVREDLDWWRTEAREWRIHTLSRKKVGICSRSYWMVERLSINFLAYVFTQNFCMSWEDLLNGFKRSLGFFGSFYSLCTVLGHKASAAICLWNLFKIMGKWEPINQTLHLYIRYKIFSILRDAFKKWNNFYIL